ncbi:hypothetical protein [Shouchella shacheensis]|nr:hypothetical protein [Shouchella shacheensis]
MTQEEKKMMLSMQKKLDRLTAEISTLKEKKESAFEPLETDEYLMQTYN